MIYKCIAVNGPETTVLHCCANIIINTLSANQNPEFYNDVKDYICLLYVPRNHHQSKHTHIPCVSIVTLFFVD